MRAFDWAGFSFGVTSFQRFGIAYALYRLCRGLWLILPKMMHHVRSERELNILVSFRFSNKRFVCFLILLIGVDVPIVTNDPQPCGSSGARNSRLTIERTSKTRSDKR